MKLGKIANWFGISAETEKRASYNTQEATTQTVTEPPSYVAQESLNMFNVDSVTEETIMQIPTAKAALNHIASNVASTPVYLYREMPDGEVKRIYNDKRVDLLNDEANAYLKGNGLKKLMVKDLLLHGTAYVSKITAGNTVLELHPLPSRNVIVQRSIANGFRAVGADIFFTYDGKDATFTNGDLKQITFKPYELIIATDNSDDGLTGKGLIEHGQKIFKEVLSEMKRTENYQARGGMPGTIIKTKGRMTEAQSATLSSQFVEEQGGANNAGKPLIVQDDMEVTPVALPEPKIAESRKAYGIEICKLFNIHYSVISGEAQDNGNLEKNNLAFLTNCLRPIMEELESSYNKSLLLESEKDAGYFFMFDTSELLKTTQIEKMEYVAKGLASGVLSINQAKAFLNLDKLPKDYTAFAPGTTMIDSEGNLVGQGLDNPKDSANGPGDDKKKVDDVDETEA